jgi:peptidoglycan hydrolase-like protein with peptidoglycan-binding domain
MAVSDVPVDSEPWDYLYIYPNDEVVTPNIVIIYLHGSNNSGYSVESLQNLARVDHPLKYAREGTLPLPDDTIFICPQSRADGEFGNQTEVALKAVQSHYKIDNDGIAGKMTFQALCG